MNVDILKKFSMDLYVLRYEEWGLTKDCAYDDKPVTPWDFDNNQGDFAE